MLFNRVSNAEPSFLLEQQDCCCGELFSNRTDPELGFKSIGDLQLCIREAIPFREQRLSVLFNEDHSAEVIARD